MSCGAGAIQALLPSGGKRRRRKIPIPKSTFTTYVDEGLMHLKKMAHRKAKYCFDRALELRPDSVLALISRSQCNMNLGFHEEALEDAEKTLTINDHFPPGLLQSGEVLFSLGYFERALMYYHQGRRIRKNALEFKTGIVKSENAIETCILDRAATQIEDIEEIIPLIKEIEEEDKLKRHQCCIRAISAETLLESTLPSLPPKNKRRERWITTEILGNLAKHKFFAERILHKLDDPRHQVGHSTKVRRTMEDILHFIDHHERLLRWMRPMYARKPGLNKNQTVVNQVEQEIRDQQHSSQKVMKEAAETAVLKNIVQIEAALANARNNDAQLACERSLRQLKKVTLSQVPRKFEFIIDIIHYRGVALMRQKMYDEAIDSFRREIKMAQKLKNDSGISRALDFIGRSNGLGGNFNDAIDAWDARMEYIKTPLERAYTNHEIGRANLELGKRELSRYYANEALSISTESNNMIWATFSRILLGQIEIKYGNYVEAEEQFKAAHELSSSGDQSQALTRMLAEILQCIKVLLERQEKAKEVAQEEDADVDEVSEIKPVTTPDDSDEDK